MKEDFEKYQKEFSELKLSEKLNRVAKTIGVKTTYPVLLLYYAFKRKETPSWAKKIITGVIGYFLLPFDLVPDFLLPIIGYTDDLSVLSFGVLALTAHIDEGVIQKSREKLKGWFGDYDTKEVDELDHKMEEKRKEEMRNEQEGTQSEDTV